MVSSKSLVTTIFLFKTIVIAIMEPSLLDNKVLLTKGICLINHVLVYDENLDCPGTQRTKGILLDVVTEK